jgi:hypothetical protein
MPYEVTAGNGLQQAIFLNITHASAQMDTSSGMAWIIGTPSP